MNYHLNKEYPDEGPNSSREKKSSPLDTVRSLMPIFAGEKKILVYAGLATLTNTLVNLSAPLIIAHVVDTYIVALEFKGVLLFVFILLGLYVVGFFTSYAQTRLMGGVGQRVLFNLRSNIFLKLQEMPVAFFNANKAGDLISRINNDTDKLNQFFSQTLIQFVGSIALMVGVAIVLLVLNFNLGIAALAPAFALFIFVRLVSKWVKRSNAAALASLGALSAEVTESLNNFKVIVAFNRRDFFRARLKDVNDSNYRASISAGIANNTFTPVFGLSSNVAQLVVVAYGAYLITTSGFTIGLLIGFLAYLANFYNPLRQLAGMWANFQVALAAWKRIRAVLDMKNEMHTRALSPEEESKKKNLKKEKRSALLEFRDVSFGYIEGRDILEKISFTLDAGKTYALVGPTGGGKTTSASLMARLYDPRTGTVFLEGRDIREIPSEVRVKKIGFILQEPILFTGSIRENILYGNELYKNLSSIEFEIMLKETGLEALLMRFDGGLEGKVVMGSGGLSLGQKQLIAFMRAVLRKPDLLILDEATANIDTVTEKLLENILKKLPPSTTRVIIAHRLNTIENADEIFFVNSPEIVKAGSMEHALTMLLGKKRES